LTNLAKKNVYIFDKSGEKERANRLHAKIVNLRKLHDASIIKIDACSSSFWAAKNRTESDDSGLSMLERQRVKVWLSHAYEQMHSVGV
jgi:hypothetical protein